MYYEFKEDIKTLAHKEISKAHKKEGIILDLSDLHYTVEVDEKNEAYLLISDLKKVYFYNSENNLTLSDIDYIVISGDFVEDGNSEASFQKAFHFIDILSKQLNIPYKNIIIVPGNHDLSWNITMNSYHLSMGIPESKDKVVTNIGKDLFYLKRNSREWHKKFANYNKYLYQRLYKVPFPEEPKEQFKVILGDFMDNRKLAFFMLNTSAEIDHFYRKITYFDTEGLIKASRQIPENDIIKIAVGHHPVNIISGYENNIPFANVLQNENFKIYLHGHVHRSISLDYLNPQNINPNMIMIGSGALSVGKNGLWPGVPGRYNVIKISKTDMPNKILVSVNTRQREYIGNYWQPAYIYYEDDGKRLTNIWSNII
ncbi:metallophosphoesterase family protein [Clostridium sp.]|jgi:predicted MPP superfamily phosphohydrolase|uniref:metallophosphoesterase family protein n=1 Tax=Clostridium sp. TaxID=1506 RepID=UPI002FDC90F6